MKNIACIIARTDSRRLERKVLKEINGIKLIEYIIRKVKRSKYVDKIYLCTSIDKNDRILLEIAKQNGISSYAGSRESVIDRMLDVAKKEKARNVIRITGDCIFVDEVYLDLMLEYHHKHRADYTRTECLPVGVTSEVIDTKALENCYKSMSPNFSQYLLLYMFQPKKYNCLVLIPEKGHRHPSWVLTVDEPEDWKRTLVIIGNEREPLNYKDIMKICSNKRINNLELSPFSSLKFPAKVFISFRACRTEMDIRTQMSHRICLRKGEYDQILRRQRI